MAVQVKSEKKKETKVVLTKPLTLEKESDSKECYRAPNLLQRLISLFKNVGLGSDLTRFQVSLIFHLLFAYNSGLSYVYLFVSMCT